MILGLLASTGALANGIKGHLYGEDGVSLPFATIYVVETGSGTTTNASGFYEVRLEPGTYTVVFQYMGYTSQSHSFTVTTGFIEKDIILTPQVLNLKEVVVKAGKEDPAYTIMRKAIAKAKFHTQQLDSYQARVYIKGSGRLLNAPFFVRKTLREEGIDSTFSFVSESVSEITYERPNVYKERVISIRSSGEDNNTSPMAYINGSFYESEVGGAISPLSPKAFSYYRFEYEGTFSERGNEISKIRVIPRSQGEGVYEGFIYIVEDQWSIHSLRLKTNRFGIDFIIKQIFAYVDQKVWLPVSHQFDVTGKVFGFKFEYDYLATVSNYQVTVNPEMNMDFKVIDEKVKKDLARELESISGKDTEAIMQKAVAGEDLTRKELRKITKEYEKQEREKQEEPEVLLFQSQEIDSLAYKKDSLYWSEIRPVPLTELEKKGYTKMDSMAVEQKKKEEGDTATVKKRKSFSPMDILTGTRSKIGDKAYFRTGAIHSYYNTVEGYNIETDLAVSKTFKNNLWMEFGPTVRYAFSRKVVNGFLTYKVSHGPSEKRGHFVLSGGRYISQFNDEEPIHPLVNSITSLFLSGNYMKLYEKDFLEGTYRKRLSDKVLIRGGMEWSQRYQLENNNFTQIISSDRRELTSNAPYNLELDTVSFPVHRAAVFNAEIEYKPWVKYRMFNDKKILLDGRSPVISMRYRKGVPGIGGGVVDFDEVSMGFKHYFKIGVRGKIDVKLNAGVFLNNREMYFMDYQHFLGNRTPFVTTDPVGSFRLLDYYIFSTSDAWVSGHGHYQFRKFLFTRLPFVRRIGIKENLLVNYLNTNTSQHYTELGYSIDYIFRVFRLEFISSFVDGKYSDFGVRIGIATNLDRLFGN